METKSKNIVTNNYKMQFLSGLTKEQVLINRDKYGNNTITNVKQDTFLKLLIESLGDPIIKILLIALGIKTIFLIQSFDWFETVGIVIAIFVASFISAISEYGSEKAFARLQEESLKLKCRVKRSGKIEEIMIDEVVVGDIILLEAGDRIPADGKIISGEITVDESSLNGETKEVLKISVPSLNSTPHKNNLVYRGTVVYSKNAVMIVTSVGDKTLYGKLARELQEKQPESPLKTRLRGLANVISKIGYIGSLLVSISYLFSVIVLANHFEVSKILNTITDFPTISSHILYALTLSVTIIVVAVPEGLPMMITLVLSSNMKRMLKNNVLVRKLVGIETAGSINILFTDKTGTLTKGKLEVIEFMSGSSKRYHSEYEISKEKEFYPIVKLSMTYNNDSNFNKEKTKVIGGNITDRAILSFMPATTNNNYNVLEKVPFDSKKKYSITVLDAENRITLIKGAPEIILSRCTSYYKDNGSKSYYFPYENIRKEIFKMTTRGIRAVAFATSTAYKKDDLSNLTFVGVVFIKDDIRKEAKEGIKLVRDAHIKTIMITGDNKETAISIGKEIGLIQSNDDVVITSSELSKMSDNDVKKIIPHLKIVARSLPQDKSRLVKLSQDLNLVVGMTGDGVNDAPALKKADVGFAMGSGTEVSKEASDIVILDDNFLSISKAILFGRTIFKSIRKFIIVQLTINMCAISLSFIGPFIGVDTPVTVIQMLWINMVMDTLAGLAFAFEPPLLEYMKEYPKKKDEAIMNKYMINQIVITGLYSALLCIYFLKSNFIHQFFRSNPDNTYIMTAFFGLFIFIDIFNSFNARTHRLNLFSHLKSNKMFILIMTFIVVVQIVLIYYGGSLFRTAGLTFNELLVMILLAFTVVPFDWIRKLILRKKGIIGGV